MKQSCTYRTVLGKFAVAIYARARFFNIFKFLESRNRKRASFSLLRNLITRLHLSLYIELSNSFLIGRKRTVNFRNQRP